MMMVFEMVGRCARMNLSYFSGFFPPYEKKQNEDIVGWWSQKGMAETVEKGNK